MKDINLALISALVLFGSAANADHKPGHAGSGGNGVGNGATLGDLSCTSDQIAKFDGTEWVCAADNAGGGTSWVVMDSDSPPKPVGEVWDLKDDGALVLIPVGGSTRLVPLNKDRIEWNQVLMFASADCTGQAYFNAQDPIENNESWFGLSLLAYATLGDPSDIRLFEVTGSEVPITADSVSFEGNCYELGIPITAVPVAPVSENLNATYPAPYTVTLK